MFIHRLSFKATTGLKKTQDRKKKERKTVHCRILQSIKSILLDVWDDRYFGIHLVIPRDHL